MSFLGNGNNMYSDIGIPPGNPHMSNYHEHMHNGSKFNTFNTPTPHYNYYEDQKKKRKEERMKIKEANNQRIQYLAPCLTGIQNMGNTCYLASALQCIANCGMCSAYLLNGKFLEALKNNEIEKLAKREMDKDTYDESKPITIKKAVLDERIRSTVTYQLYRVIQAMWAENCVVVPRQFKTTIGKINDQFLGAQQNDSQEVISLILQQIDEETAIDVNVTFKDIPQKVLDLNTLRDKCYSIINNPDKTPEEKQDAHEQYRNAIRNDIQSATLLGSYTFWKSHMKKHSIITDLFTGLFCTHIVCSKCSFVTIKFESFTTLSLPIPENKDTTLEECLKSFSHEEVMDGDNKRTCDICKKKTKAIKTMFIWELPEILIIHFIRFKMGLHSISKINSKVTFPLKNLKLDECQLEWHKSNDSYDLFATSNHRGSYGSGHYVANCQNALNREWYLFDDDDVLHLEEKELNDIIPSAYMLFYKKKSSDISELHSDSESSDEEDNTT